MALLSRVSWAKVAATIASEEVTTDSVAAELEEIQDSLENLDQTKPDEATRALGQLYRTIQKLNYLLQVQMSTKLATSSPTAAALGQKSLFVEGIAPQTPSEVPPSAVDDNTDVLNDLDEWIQRIKAVLAKLALFLNASHYTIGVQSPFSIVVSMTFEP